jgi:SAM-dependent methyltransferase
VYKELRTYGSTGAIWAAPFLAADMPLVERLKISSLRLDPRCRAIRRYVPRGATVLDAGCGMGQWPVFLTAHGYRTVGVDFSGEMIAALQRRYPRLDWRRGVVQELRLPDASVDALISWGVIEHDEGGPAHALTEFARVLRSGGMAFITVPIDSEPQRRASAAQFAGPGAEVFFQYFLTPQELSAAVASAGLEVLEPVRPVSRHHALAYPDLYCRVSRLHPLLQRVTGWTLKPTLAFRPSSVNMLLAVARRA